MRFGVLGSLQVVDGEGTVTAVRAGKQRVVLASLLLSGGKVVSSAALAEALWDDCPPANASAVMRTYVHRLRHALGPAGTRITGRPSGWAVDLRSPEELDLTEVDQLRRVARAAAEAGEWRQVSSLLTRALDLWRGEPLVDVPSAALARRETESLAELRLELTEARIDADLILGRHRQLVTELRRLAAEHPLREHIRVQLMLAFYRCGDQAAALGVYQDARGSLAEELGVEPGRELHDMQRKVLIGDPDLALSPAAAVQRVAAPPRAGLPDEVDRGVDPVSGLAGLGSLPPVVPRPLPAPVRYFAGRAVELRRLSALAAEAASAGPQAMVIAAIVGMAGVGKTALALHFAHQVATEFADGQLYVNLRGFDPHRPPVPAAETIAGFLAVLGVDPRHIPVDLDARAALYRSRVAGRRMLIVLDNATDSAQVRPLLPGSGGSLVVVTSRSQLPGLAAADGAHLITLDVLGNDDAASLLAARVGPERVAGEPEAAVEIVSLCGRLPLALAIAGARAATAPAHPLAALTAELREADARLDALDVGEAATSTRGVLSWSYRHLTADAARMLRLLGIHPGPDITAVAAASMAAVALKQARHTLRTLAAASLITEHTPGRYALHDLLRAYAAEQAHAEESADDLLAATGRILDHYLHTAHAADRQLNSVRPPLTLDPARAGVRPEDIPAGAGLGWFETEHRVLLASVSLAVKAGFDSHAWQLPWALTNFFDLRGHWTHWSTTQHAALAAARRLKNLDAQARAHHSLGKALVQLSSYDDAGSHLRRAATIYGQLADHVGEADIHVTLSVAFGRQERYREALASSLRALKLFEAAGPTDQLALVLSNAARAYAHLGEFGQALMYCEQALDIGHRVCEPYGEAHAWDTLGYIHQQTGDHAEAVRCYEIALGLYRERGYRWYQATTLNSIGDVHHAANRPAAARDAWAQALSILTDLHHPDADRVRAKLALRIS
jgi:DNA-binding SARP family transcriptional activator/tetratricopeptide (TPR) repeat protein